MTIARYLQQAEKRQLVGGIRMSTRIDDSRDPVRSDEVCA